MIEICFEGDGILGIEWGNENGRLKVKDILAGTVANEYYELKKGLIVLKIDDEEYNQYSYIKKISLIMDIWRKNSIIRIMFQEEEKEIYYDVHDFLEENGYLKYYDEFVELGAKKIEDFEYIEKDDLYVMGLTLDQVDKLYKRIKMRSTSEVFEEL